MNSVCTILPTWTDRRLGFYDPLREFADSLSNIGKYGVTNGDFLTLDLIHKLPDLRPSRTWYGVKEGYKSAAAIAAKATVSPAPKATKAVKTAGANKGSLLTRFANAAKKLLSSFEDDDEGEGDFVAPFCPTTSKGSLYNKPKFELA